MDEFGGEVEPAGVQVSPKSVETLISTCCAWASGVAGLGSRNGIANCRWVVRTSSGSLAEFPDVVAEKVSEKPATRHRKRNSRVFKRNISIDFMNLSKSPYIDLTIGIGHLFPKIVLFRYNRFGSWAQTQNVSFNFGVHGNGAIEASGERRVACSGLRRRKRYRQTHFSVNLRRKITISDSKTAFQREVGNFGSVAGQFVDPSGCCRLWDRCYRFDP